MLPRNVAERLDQGGIPKWRKDSTILFGQIEAKGDCGLFKSDKSSIKANAKRWDHFFSEEAQRRKPSSIKAAGRAASEPGMISLGAGAPSAAYFPFEAVHVNIANPPGFSGAPEGSESILHMAKYDFEPNSSEYSLDVALNYGQGSGAAQMLRFVTEHTELMHSPPYADWGCCMTVGSTSAWDSTLRMFCEKGDYIIVEKYTFASALETAWSLGINALPVGMDAQGLIPDALDKELSSWEESKRKARKPFLLYMVPTGQNPTGATQSLERRKAIYAVAQKHGLYIVEDEPYYYLQLPAFRAKEPSGETQGCGLVPSYLSLDVDGRVLRMDSLSKVLAPGSRTGWVTASQQVIEKFVRQNETSSQHPSGFSQVIIFKLLNHHWGHLGFFKWLENIRAEYMWRRDAFVQACVNFLPEGIAHFVPSEAGMFQWIEIDWKSHPLYKTGAGHQKIQQTIFDSAVQKKVFLVPGTCFWSASELPEDRMFFRATYASASQEDLVEAARRFGDALKDEFQ
ncbi:hypothetical protein N7448_003330 [Penicillium atrosanguineum]|uniref:S-adenosyl-L-methionine-dependent methyltransferase n=1 Tax=Penicillium atrosanguineum TaxID=1132637 RepID=UPI00238A9858|nr:S-adenosyl-L-methionine-dependent methyltransferase [Penicillium atrosanguineum]KAJ5139922.1 hypothetical protein N7448_003330 [Penicillium atrosanguineum]KAJ5309838.1 S-adenosyl-L-methionine-dependent methyltransferase [Penicillium atrosanguineum]